MFIERFPKKWWETEQLAIYKRRRRDEKRLLKDGAY